MTKSEDASAAPAEGVSVRIRDNGTVLTLEYDGALTVHKSSLW